MIRLLLIASALLAGCATVKPDPALVHWGDDDAWWSAALHAEQIGGVAYRSVGTSMEPFIVEGDYQVGDFSVEWKDLLPGFVVTYDPNWADSSVPLASHMLVQPYGDDAWVVTGLNNRYSESGSRALMRADYRAKVVAVFTARVKP